MKKILVVLTVFALFSCQTHNNNEALLQSRIDSLQTQLSETYKPGFGDFMSNIQAHHAKLWYAGKNQNWKLAEYEVKEIRENFDDIKKYETDRNEVNLIGMIVPPLEQVSKAIQNKDMEQFNNNFTTLTKTCNACHLAAKYEFNVVKIPDEQTFSNQDFKPAK